MEKFKRLFGAQDMTQGSPWYNLAAFSIPLLIGNFAQQMYNTVDSIIVGKYVGDGALAAVGVANPIINLLILLFVGVSTGAGILVSQYFGARDREKLNKAVGTCITLTMIASVLLMIVGPLITHPILQLLDTPPEVYDLAADYLIILFLGAIGSGFYNILGGVLRGLGDSVFPLLFLIVACVLNIFLDIAFVAGFGMTTDGVALATILAQLISAILCFVRLLHMKDIVNLKKEHLIPDREISRETIRLGIPSGLSQAIFSMSAIIVQALTNTFGTSVIACSTVVMRVDGFAMMPNFTFGMAMTTFVGQNVGARRLDRVKQGVVVGLKGGLMIATALVLCILLFGRNMLGWFTQTEELIALGTSMLRVLALGYIAMAVTQTLSGVMRGAGDTLTPMWISVITTVIIRMPIAYLWAFLTRSEANPNGDCQCLYYSLLISWVCGAIITSICYKRGGWRRKLSGMEWK